MSGVTREPGSRLWVILWVLRVALWWAQGPQEVGGKEVAQRGAWEDRPPLQLCCGTPTFMGKKSQMHFKCMWKSRGQHRNAGEEPKVDGSDWIWVPLKLSSPAQFIMNLSTYNFIPFLVSPLLLSGISVCIKEKRRLKSSRTLWCSPRYKSPSVCPILVGKKKKEELI